MFSFQGRASRGSYAGTVFTSLVLLGLVGGGYYYMVFLGAMATFPPMYFAGAVALAGAFLLLGVLLFIAGTVRRYHDRGKSGAWALLIPTGIGIPVVLMEGLLMKGTEGQNAFDLCPVVPEVKTAPTPSPIKQETKIETKPEAKSEIMPEIKTETKQEIPKAQAVPQEIKQETKPEILAVKTDTDIVSNTPLAAKAEMPVTENKLSEAVLTPPMETKVPITEIKPGEAKEELKKDIKPDIQAKTPEIAASPKGASEGAPIDQTGMPYTIPPVRSMTEMLAELERLSKDAPIKKAEAPAKEAKPPVTKEAIASVASIQPAPVKEVPIAPETAVKNEMPKIKFGPGADIADVPSSENTEDLTKNLNSLMEDAKGALDELPEVMEELPPQASANSTPGTISFGPKP